MFNVTTPPSASQRITSSKSNLKMFLTVGDHRNKYLVGYNPKPFRTAFQVSFIKQPERSPDRRPRLS